MRLMLSALGSAWRLGPVPPHPAWCGNTHATRSSNAPATSAVLPSRECPTTATRLASNSFSPTA